MPVYLPLEKLEKCFKCDKKNDLRLCSRCGEATYCSEACQKSDWSVHKEKCGKTEIIELSKFYPVLACLAELSHFFPEKPIHPAIAHKVINDCNPGVSPCELPGGSSAKLLVLGEPHPPGGLPRNERWITLAKTTKIEAKLFRRVMREGNALQIAMSICLALVNTVYTTTYSKGAKGGDNGERVRLRYGKSPIADFGVCVGSANVKNQDKLAYWLPDGDILMGQDPNEHYWIYFTTVRGEEITLDLAMFTFNMCLMIHTQGFLPPHMSEDHPYAPVCYRDREMRKNTPDLQKERRRMSVLRNPALKDVFGDATCWNNGALTEVGLGKIVALAEEFAGHKFVAAEERILKLSTERHFAFLKEDIRSRRWKIYPKEISLAVEQDPGECDDLDDRTTAWWKTMRKWKREHRKTKRSAEK